MTNLTDADLDSDLVDLTDLTLAELRHLASPSLAELLASTYAHAEFNTGNELQEQKG